MIELLDLESRIRPACNGTDSEDHQGGGIWDQSTTWDDVAERAVAGALLLSPHEFARPVLNRLLDDDLADPRCRFVVATVRRMLAEGVPADPVTFASYVDRRALLEPGPTRANLRSFIAELTALETAPVAGNLGWYADAVIVEAARRRVVAAGQRLAALGYGADVADLPAAVRAELLAVLDALERAGVADKAVSR